MDYTTLIAAKGTAGSLANWVNYTKLDTATILDEAQALIYTQLRAREMRTQRIYDLASGAAHIALPSDFLDPIGDIRLATLNYSAKQKDPSFIRLARTYDTNSGSLGANPFTTTNASTTVTVALTGHGLVQDSIFTVAGAAAFNGVTINGAFPVTAIVDANDFTIDITSLGTVPNASSSGGGAAATYSADILVQGTPMWWGIWDEAISFDQAFYQETSAILHYYRSLPLLSASNATNFLTKRYPALLRTACQTAAADFMKDDTEYQKCGQRLAALFQSINAENDGANRGMEIYFDNP